MSSLLDASVPDNWPVDPIILEILKKRLDDPAAFEWADYIYIHREDNEVIGDGGFKDRPDENGCVEIGYGLIPEYRNKGLATEAAKALLNHAFSNAEVTAVRAETVTTGFASMRILKKLGMEMCGSRHDDEDGDLYCWRISRDQYRANVQRRST